MKIATALLNDIAIEKVSTAKNAPSIAARLRNILRYKVPKPVYTQKLAT
jgi:hypothetical protein